MSLTYRLSESRDINGINRLWDSETNWGSLGEWQRRWFAMNPCEGSMTIVAVDEEGEVGGELVYMAYQVSVGGREYRALRPIATILAKKCRPSESCHPKDHPAYRMYEFGRDKARDRGDGLIFSLPNPVLAPAIRLWPRVQSTKFPLFSLPLPLAKPFTMPAGYTTRPFAGWDEQVDRLWKENERLHDCIAIRGSRELKWKLSSRPYVFTAIERAGELAGLVASLSQNVQWLICDILCVDREDGLRASLIAACNVANENLQTSNPVPTYKKAAILGTHLLQPAVEKLGFERDKYNFLFITESLRPEISPEDIAPERWYCSAND